MTVRRLDRVTLKAWELTLGDTSDYPKFATLKDFLSSRIRTLELVSSTTTKANAGTHTSNTAASSPKSNSKVTRSQVHHFDTEPKCNICPAYHKLFSCPVFHKKSELDRFEIVKQNNLCVSCLMSGHRTSACPSNKLCRHCDKSHHTLLHRSPGATKKATESKTTGAISGSTNQQVLRLSPPLKLLTRITRLRLSQQILSWAPRISWSFAAFHGSCVFERYSTLAPHIRWSPRTWYMHLKVKLTLRALRCLLSVILKRKTSLVLRQ